MENKENKKSGIVINHQPLLHRINIFSTLKENWQLKVIAFILALALWFYVYKQ